MAINQGHNNAYKVCDECGNPGSQQYVMVSGYFPEDDLEDVCLSCFTQMIKTESAHQIESLEAQIRKERRKSAEEIDKLKNRLKK